MGKLNVFISYAHKDADYFAIFREGLKSHLFTSSGFNFGTWEDSKLYVGSFWDNEIKQNMGLADIAILCVSANFLNSKYIREEEFKTLKESNKNVYIFPVYFNHCNIEAWRDLSAIQFFKPGGDNYEKPNNEDFAFCDLIKFSETYKEPIPNSNIDLYIMDFVKQIENTLSRNSTTPPTMGVANPQVPDASLNYASNVQKHGIALSMDKIVTLIIISAIALSLVLIFYFLFDKTSTDHFKVNVSVAMFFGSIGSFVFNKKNVPVNRR